MEGRNGPITILPLSPKIGGQEKGNYPSIGQYLTREQANLVTRKQNQMRYLTQRQYNKNWNARDN